MKKGIHVFEKLILRLYKRSQKILPPKFLDFQKFKYLFFGILNVGIGWIIYFITYNFIIHKSNVELDGLITISSHVFALILSFSITFFFGFFMNFLFVFNLHGRNSAMLTKLMKYFLSNIGSIVINYLLLKLFVEKLEWYPTPSQIVSTVVVIVYSFFAQKKFTFISLNKKID